MKHTMLVFLMALSGQCLFAGQSNSAMTYSNIISRIQEGKIRFSNESGTSISNNEFAMIQVALHVEKAAKRGHFLAPTGLQIITIKHFQMPTLGAKIYFENGDEASVVFSQASL